MRELAVSGSVAVIALSRNDKLTRLVLCRSASKISESISFAGPDKSFPETSRYLSDLFIRIISVRAEQVRSGKDSTRWSSVRKELVWSAFTIYSTPLSSQNDKRRAVISLRWDTICHAPSSLMPDKSKFSFRDNSPPTRFFDSGAHCIFEGNFNPMLTLVNMSLQRNYIAATNPDTARSLTKMLQVNKTLTHLDISYNQFENGICTFQGLKLNSTLLLLNLRSTGITDDNAKCIGQALESNCTLQTLDISHNPFLGVTGTFFILDSLVFSTTLKKLYVDIKLETKNEFHRARRKKGLPSIDIIWW